MNELIYFDEITQSLSKAVKWGGENLRDVPGLLKMVLERQMWKKRYVVMTGQEVGFDSFDEYVTASVPEGLGATMDIIRRLCKDTEVMPLLEREIRAVNVHGVNQQSTGLDMSSPQSGQGGNSRAYTIARLKRDAPEIAEQVIEGKISAAEGRRQAGYKTDTQFRPRLSTSDMPEVAQTLAGLYSREQIDELISLLLEGLHKDQ